MKNKLILSLVVLMVAASVLAVSAQDVATVDDAISDSVSDDEALSIDSGDDSVYQDDGVKEVWIDQTVDESMAYINGDLTVYDRLTHSKLVLNLSNSSSSKFSTVNSDTRNLEIQTVYNALDHAKELLNAKNIKWISWASKNVTKVFDYRKYETVEEGDAQLIGDSDYLNGAYGVDYTVTHIASGAYGRIVNLTAYVIAEANYDQTQDDSVEPADNATNNTSVNNTANTTNNAVNDSDKNVTNNASIKPKDVAKETGIPFAALIVALLSAGILIRRRR